MSKKEYSTCDATKILKRDLRINKKKKKKKVG